MRYRFAIPLLLPTLAAAQELPRALILGDSIYNEPARSAQRMLEGRVQLVVPKDRIGDTTTTLRNLDRILGKQRWDLIHFNFGLADLHYRDPNTKSIRAMSKHAGGVRVTSPELYQENLEAIVQRLRATGAKLLWATTTPIKSSKFDSLYDPGSELEYNKIAARVMNKHGVAINDMHTYVRTVLTGRRDTSPFGYNRQPLHPPIVRSILRELDLVRPVKGPVKVFVMVGGWAHIGGGIVTGQDRPRPDSKLGSLDNLVLDKSTAKDYAHLLDDQGRWAKRTDVWVPVRPPLPEVGRSRHRLRRRPPTRHRQRAIVRPCARRSLRRTSLHPQGLPRHAIVDQGPPPPERGKAWPRIPTAHSTSQSRTRARMQDRFPDYATESDNEICGLVLNLGERDTNAAAYAKLLPKLIADLRKDLSAPKLPVVIVGTGRGGRDKPAFPKIIEAQQSVARAANHIAYVETRDFWPPPKARFAERVPSAERWFGNAESFLRVGATAGHAIVKLLR